MKQLTAYDLVNVGTKIGLITNTQHCKNVYVAKDTETARHLADFGITTDAHRREVMITLSEELQIEDFQIIENIICETLRWISGDEGDKLLGVDTVGINQPLYLFVRDHLTRIASDGSSAIIDLEALRKYKAPRIYSPKYKWWELERNGVSGVLGDDFNVYFTKKSKYLRERSAKI